VVGTITTPARAPFPIPEFSSEVLDLHYFPDDQSLAILLAGGDIATLQLDESSGQYGEVIYGSERMGLEKAERRVQVEIVGSIDSGIKAAAWSPDDEQLILITG
jgi:elongator complex protein 1